MKDRFGRTVSALRVSVTDRCNLRCWYCVPTRNYALIRHQDLLTFDEIEAVVRAAAGLGFHKIRLTGGEPLMRPALEDLVARLAVVPGIDDLAMTTNGLLLGQHARSLAKAGLRRVNISLDAIEPARYADITGSDALPEVLAGIDAALEAGLTPVKLNCVVEKMSDEPDARAVAAFAASRGCEVRFIPRMDMERGLFSKVIGGAGGDCAQCDRLRLSCSGLILPCLFSEPAFSVRELGPEEALRRAVLAKPETGGRCARNWMLGIGG